MVELYSADIKMLRDILLREKATALSELREAQRSATAYSDRAWADTRLANAEKRYNDAVTLLDIIGD